MLNFNHEIWKGNKEIIFDLIESGERLIFWIQNQMQHRIKNSNRPEPKGSNNLNDSFYKKNGPGTPFCLTKNHTYFDKYFDTLFLHYYINHWIS